MSDQFDSTLTWIAWSIPFIASKIAFCQEYLGIVCLSDWSSTQICYYCMYVCSHISLIVINQEPRITKHQAVRSK
jgi:hypothetical protein